MLTCCLAVSRANAARYRGIRYQNHRSCCHQNCPRQSGTWQEPQKVRLADGTIRTAQVLLVRELRIGHHVVRDVEAFVGSGDSMLLAFPIVNDIAPFTIDTRTGELIFHTNG